MSIWQTIWKDAQKAANKVVKLGPTLVTIASIITAVTPNPTDDAVLDALHKALDIIALNVGHNSQTDDVASN